LQLGFSSAHGGGGQHNQCQYETNIHAFVYQREAIPRPRAIFPWYHHLMRAGFVLAGGRSTRMGRDKALLPAGPQTLVEHVADLVREAAGNVTLIGPAHRYAHLGIPILSDSVVSRGPLSGVYTALNSTSADWNLIVACDMPGLSAEFLGSLLDFAESRGKDCLAPVTARGLEPLCSVYHARVAPLAARALHANLLKMQDFVRSLDFAEWPVPDPAMLRNVNTPQDL
jgi:molybdopterin-guanine dinucleotide biosynthesis protein A